MKSSSLELKVFQRTFSSIGPLKICFIGVIPACSFDLRTHRLTEERVILVHSAAVANFTISGPTR